MKHFLLSFFVFAFLFFGIPFVPRVFGMPKREGAQVIHILKKETGEVIAVPVEDFVIGVLDGFGKQYPKEALKAIAVAVRSSAVYSEKYRPVHEEAAVCDDPECCNAVLPERFSERSAEAAAETAAVGLFYEGKLCPAPTCADAGGVTEPCEALYGVAFDFLGSVTESHPGSGTAVSVPLKSIRERIGADPDALSFACDRTGRVREVRWEDQTMSGTEFAIAFGLPSLLFTAEKKGNAVIFTCYGKGSGVGLSRSGAAKMAEDGTGYAEILDFYYPGTEIGKID